VALVAIFLALVPLAFSEEFLEAVFEIARAATNWVLLLVAAALLLLVGRLILRLRPTDRRAPIAS
jgi:hypothetical protein